MHDSHLSILLVPHCRLPNFLVTLFSKDLALLGVFHNTETVNGSRKGADELQKTFRDKQTVTIPNKSKLPLPLCHGHSSERQLWSGIPWRVCRPPPVGHVCPGQPGQEAETPQEIRGGHLGSPGDHGFVFVYQQDRRFTNSTSQRSFL